MRDSTDIQVLDSKSKEDFTKSVLIQMIREEKENDQSVLPTDFLFKALCSRNDSLQDFFRNHVSASYEVYIKTKEQFDNQFRSVLEIAFSVPRTLEKLIPGVEVMHEVLT